MLGYSSRGQLAKSITTKRAKRRAGYIDRIEAAPPWRRSSPTELLEFALAGGGSAFAVNCSQCHGRGAAGYVGYPNLNDDDWIWGGKPGGHQPHHSLRHPFGHDETRFNEMPAYGRDEILTREEINDVAEYVLSLSGSGKTPRRRHGARYALSGAMQRLPHGKRRRQLRTGGAQPDGCDLALRRRQERRGGEPSTNSRAGMMPAWTGRLDEATIKQLAIYVHSLGGGE